MIEEHGLGGHGKSTENLHLLDPLGYLEFLNLMEHAGLVITDSGGIQEETTYLGVPCLTLRNNTERPITIEIGTNELCGLDVERVVSRGKEIFQGNTKQGKIPELWDGKAAERITKILAQ